MKFDDLYEKYDFMLLGHGKSFAAFLEQMEDIPGEDWLRILIDLYTYGGVDMEVFSELLEEALDYESESDRDERIQENMLALNPYVNKNGKIKVYRGYGEGSADSSIAVSYTLSKEKAKWFANRRRLAGDKNIGVLERIVDVRSVIYYDNTREEQEVIILPYK